jgi:type IV pilus assembly protein PilC
VAFQVYRVTLQSAAAAAGARRRRTIVCSCRADIERLIVRGPTEYVSEVEEGSSMENAIANFMAQRRPAPKARERFYGLLKTYLDAKPDLAFALEKSAPQLANPALGNAICRLMDAVRQGKNLNISLHEKFAGILPPADIACLNAAVGVGSPQLAVDKLEQKAKFQVGLAGKIKKAAIYPLVVMGLASVGLVLAATVSMPKMLQTLQQFQATPSGTTKLVIAMGKIIQNYPFIVALPVVGIAGLLFQYQKLYATSIVQRLIGYFGPLRRFIFRTSMSQSLFTFAMLDRARVPLIEALTMASEETTSPPIRRFYAATCARLASGTPSLFEAAIPNAELLGTEDGYEFVALLQAGEQSGNTADLAEKVALTYRRDSEDTVEVITQLIGPALMMCVGLMIVVLAAMILSPIGEIYHSLIPQAFQATKH